jgi:hypothetical protein
MKPIPDKAEIVLEYPDKFYSGTFERSSRFDAHTDEGGIALTFARGSDDSERKSVHMHIHYALFAEILNELAKSVSAIPPAAAPHRDALAAGASALAAALSPTEPAAQGAEKDDSADLTPDKELKLLHILE